MNSALNFSIPLFSSSILNIKIVPSAKFVSPPWARTIGLTYWSEIYKSIDKFEWRSIKIWLKYQWGDILLVALTDPSGISHLCEKSTYQHNICLIFILTDLFIFKKCMKRLAKYDVRLFITCETTILPYQRWECKY